MWIADKGNAFLSGSNTIGDDTAATQGLLKKHDIFEAETEVGGTWCYSTELDVHSEKGSY